MKARLPIASYTTVNYNKSLQLCAAAKTDLSLSKASFAYRSFIDANILNHSLSPTGCFVLATLFLQLQNLSPKKTFDEEYTMAAKAFQMTFGR